MNMVYDNLGMCKNEVKNSFEQWSTIHGYTVYNTCIHQLICPAYDKVYVGQIGKHIRTTLTEYRKYLETLFFRISQNMLHTYSNNSCTHGKYLISNVHNKNRRIHEKQKYNIFKTTKDNSQINDENVFGQSPVFELLSNRPGRWITTSVLHNKGSYQVQPLTSQRQGEEQTF